MIATFQFIILKHKGMKLPLNFIVDILAAHKIRQQLKISSLKYDYYYFN